MFDLSTLSHLTFKSTSRSSWKKEISYWNKSHKPEWLSGIFISLFEGSFQCDERDHFYKLLPYANSFGIINKGARKMGNRSVLSSVFTVHSIRCSCSYNIVLFTLNTFNF